MKQAGKDGESKRRQDTLLGCIHVHGASFESVGKSGWHDCVLYYVNVDGNDLFYCI